MLEELASALDRLATTDLETVTDGELHDAVVTAERLNARFAAERTRLVALWDSRRLWASDGSKAPGARLARDAGLSPSAARAMVRRARNLRGMPATAAAFAAGEIAPEQVDALAGCARAEFAGLFARDETMLVEHAKTLSFPNFRRVIGYWRQHADAERAEDQATRQREGRFFNAAVTFGGTIDLRGLLDPVEGRIVANELARLEQQLFEADWKAARAQHGEGAGVGDLGRTAPQRRADALVEMARRSSAMVPGSTLARPLVTVLVGYETFAGPVCELFDGTVVTPGQVADLLHDADIERVVFDGRSRVMDIGEHRYFTGALRRAIEVRDRCCTFPGCDEPVERCEVDHIVEWSRGGKTVQDNGRLLCHFHNRQRNRRPDLEPDPDLTPDGPDP